MSSGAMSLYSVSSSMDKSRRILTFTCFFTSTACLILLAASLATPKWILVKPVRSLNRSIGDSDPIIMSKASSSSSVSPSSQASVTVSSSSGSGSTSSGASGDAVAGEDARKFRGTIYFGLFQGTKILNYGFGDRSSPLFSKCIVLITPVPVLLFLVKESDVLCLY